VNGMLVGFGQTICKPLAPKCYDCAAAKLCPYKPKTKAPIASEKQTKTKRKRQAKLSEESESSDSDDSEYVSKKNIKQKRVKK